MDQVSKDTEVVVDASDDNGNARQDNDNMEGAQVQLCCAKCDFYHRIISKVCYYL